MLTTMNCYLKPPSDFCSIFFYCPSKLLADLSKHSLQFIYLLSSNPSRVLNIWRSCTMCQISCHSAFARRLYRADEWGQTDFSVVVKCVFFFFFDRTGIKTGEGEAMACAHVPLDEEQVTEPGPLGREVTLPALVSQCGHLYVCFFQTDVQRSISLERSLHPEANISAVSLVVSTRTGRRSAALCLTRPPRRPALLLRWRSFWNMPNLLQRT